MRFHLPERRVLGPKAPLCLSGRGLFYLGHEILSIAERIILAKIRQIDILPTEGLQYWQSGFDSISIGYCDRTRGNVIDMTDPHAQ